MPNYHIASKRFRSISLRTPVFLTTLLVFQWAFVSSQNVSAQEAMKVYVQEDFDVVIAGGSTAAFAAAVASAKSGAKTALLEPTDWIGGQLTSSGVPAVDEAWHSIKDKKTEELIINVSKWARDPRNITANFLQTLEGLKECGDCWVSRFCFRPRIYHDTQLLPMQREVEENLVVFLETVVKQVELDPSGKKMQAITAIRRFPDAGLKARGYDRLPSEDLAEWYSYDPSPRFAKEILVFRGRDGRLPVFVDATEWGEILALSGADYLQGAEEEEGETGGNDTCGQSTVYCFIQEIQPEVVEHQSATSQASSFGFGDYRDRDNAWDLIWTYRRVRGNGKPSIGDLCLQNWGYSAKLKEGGNDYPFGYLFKSKEDTAAETHDWRGGINLEVLAAAEQRAIGWHHWFRNQAPKSIEPDQITLAGHELGTDHGLAKLPYIRDTRRSIGLDRFVLKFADLTGPPGQKTGTAFPDRVALGAYPADIHPLSNCQLPDYLLEAHDTLPFYIPYRSLTHYQIENLLVAGKTMAQSFLVNSATRLHPIEWSSGTATGVVAAYMANHGKSSREVLGEIEEVQQLISEQTPINWTAPE